MVGPHAISSSLVIALGPGALLFPILLSAIFICGIVGGVVSGEYHCGWMWCLG